MKKHRNNLMRRGLAAILSGMMLLATVTPAMAEEPGQPQSVVGSATAPESASTDPTAPTPAPTTGEVLVEQSSTLMSATPQGSNEPEAVPEAGTGNTGATNETPAPVEENSASDGSEEEAPAAIELLPEDGTAPEHTLIEINEEETTKELSTEPMTLEAHTYNGINVIVDADAGVLPADAHLSVFEVKSETHRTETAEKLDEAEVDYDDYMVLDISLYDSAFNKIEPESGVRVSITMDAEKLPEEAVAETLGVQHLEEDENGEVKDVVQVADNGLETEGFVEVTDNNEVAADFEVGSFSKFVITWKSYRPGFRLNVTTVDQSGNQVAIDWIDDGRIKSGNGADIDLVIDLNDGDENIMDAEPAVTYMFDELAKEFNIYNIGQYQYVEARIGTDQVYGIEMGMDGGNRVAWHLNDDGTRKGGKWKNTIDSARGQSDLNVTMVYKQRGDNLDVVPTVDSTSLGIEMHMFRFNAQPQMVGGKEMYAKAGLGTDAKQAYSYAQYGEYAKRTDFQRGINEVSNINQIPKNSDGKPDTKIKFPRGQLWQNLTSYLIPSGAEFPLVDTGGRGDYKDYVSGDVATTPLEEGVNATSLGEWFNPDGNGKFIYKAQEVNHLFREDIYRDNNYFYYSSDRNAAVLNDTAADQTEFTVYQQTMSPAQNTAEGSYVFWAERGNFLPYNQIDPKTRVAQTGTDMAGNELRSQDDAMNTLYGENLRGKDVYRAVPTTAGNDPMYNNTGASPGGTGMGGVSKGIAYYFGLSMKADFYQPEDGLVENPAQNNAKQPMVFEFSGDDDLWVYIDDVLVLDLGGSHDAQSGVIDFATGDVYWTDNGSYKMKTDGSGTFDWRPDKTRVYPNQSVFEETYQNFTGETVPLKYDGKTTIRAMYERAIGVAGTKALDIWADENQGNTFRSGTPHTIKVYFMEHGGGASNLRLSFNIPVEPIGDLEVAKEFTEEGLTYEKDGKAVIPDDFRGVFTVYTAKYDEVIGQYGVGEFVDEVELTQETYEAGLFEERKTADGKVQFVHTFKRLALSQLYIVDEKIYKSGKGYLGENGGTEFDLSGTKGSAATNTNQANAKRLMSTSTASSVESVGATKDKIYGFTWGALSGTKYHVRAYTHDKEGNVVPVNDAEELLQDVFFWAKDIIRDKIEGQDTVQNGNKIFFEDVLKDLKLQKAGSYILNHMEWGSEGIKVAGIEFQTSGSTGFYMLDDAGNRVTNLITAANQSGYEIRVFYDKAFYEYRSDAFELYGMKHGNYPATVVVENKYLTPLSVRKILRSRMETDPNRDFSFRIYLQNRDGSNYNPTGGLVGTVYEVKTIKDEQTQEEREELVEKMVQDENGVQVPDKRYLIGQQDENGGWYFAFNLKRNEEITFGLPKGVKYRVVELVEQGYKVTGAINLKDSVGSNTELAMTGEEYTEKEVRMKKWMTQDELVLTEETLVTITNSFDIARTGLSMSTIPFILMVVFALLAIGGLAFITIRRRAMNIDD